MGRFVIATLMLVFISLSSRVWAYPTPMDFSGNLQRWNITADSDPITYAVKGDDAALAEYASAVGISFGKWQEVASSYISFIEAPTYEEAQITIALNSKGVGSFSSGYAEIATDGNGRMSGCHLELLVGETVSYETFAKTSLHELGHCIGLGHSLVSHSIMSYELDKSEFNLDTDDIAAVTRLYPSDGSKPALPQGCSVSGARGGSSLVLLCLLLFPLFFVYVCKLNGVSPTLF